MDNKKNILESWIMVEHLSEGDISLKERGNVTLNELQDDNYYRLMEKTMRKSSAGKYEKRGIVVYFDIFPFAEVIDFLRNKYNLPEPEEKVKVGNKFSFALCFDKNLKLNSELTFLTESYYIRKYREIPTESQFFKFEERYRKRFQEMFDYSDEETYEEHFNTTMASIMMKHKVDTKNCRMKVLRNLETEAANMHSFFVRDLQNAKKIRSEKLDDYILGRQKSRVNLDTRAESDQFNPDAIAEILQPNNYPLGRFPGNPKYAPALMQQVAINLATDYDNDQMRSVNGPPGTGKTTLLKDIFAQLVVEQAFEIAQLSEKHIKGSEKTRYWNYASIGILPENIAENGILVASSNNGAVQNIVNELPLLKEIDEDFRKSLLDADYFTEIANAVGRKTSDSEVVPESVESDTRLWGLFSLEGGKKENMRNITAVMKKAADYLKNEYTPNPDVYDDYIAKYQEVRNYRQERQNLVDQRTKLPRLVKELARKREQYPVEKKAKEATIAAHRKNYEEKLLELEKQIANLLSDRGVHQKSVIELDVKKRELKMDIQSLESRKPGFLEFKKRKEHNEKMKVYSDELKRMEQEERPHTIRLNALDEKIQALRNEITSGKNGIDQEERAFDYWNTQTQQEILSCQEKVVKLRNLSRGINAPELDFTQDYESLQLSNPWFDVEYRRLQSELFIAALKVRKEFLYANVKNIEAAYRIWSYQKEHLERKIVIQEAWNWMNMVIPVISSTFASISSMCSNLGEKTLGYLFIDEAGQALPQASVGAIYRSRRVMAVGDPSQIKPVLTLDSSVLNMLGDYYGVSREYLSEDASTQTLLDVTSRYGFYKDKNKEKWVGIPLWVHRRCKYPMFDIANQISYGGNMVQGKKENGAAKWFDIGGTATDKYVPEQGKFLREMIQKMIQKNPDIIDREKPDTIYVISPFNNVAFQLSRELNRIGFTRYEKGKPTNVGTVHTFQGKEAPIVFLVLGADWNSKGAANWAMGSDNPNIMNVAATRAKEQFYIIGDQKLYRSLNSDVINDTVEIMEGFNAKRGE